MEEKDTKFVRVSVSLSRALLKKVDSFAVVCHVSRSAVVTYALMMFLLAVDDTSLDDTSLDITRKKGEREEDAKADKT